MTDPLSFNVFYISHFFMDDMFHFITTLIEIARYNICSIHEGDHDAHGRAGYTSVGVHLLQDFVDGVGFPPPPLRLLISSTCGLCLAGGLLCSF